MKNLAAFNEQVLLSDVFRENGDDFIKAAEKAFKAGDCDLCKRYMACAADSYKQASSALSASARLAITSNSVDLSKTEI